MSLIGKTDAPGSKPKWLSAADKAVTFFVSTEEAKATVNKAKGITSPGWWKIVTRQDANGNNRVSAECLATMSSLSALNATAGDAADDAVVGDVDFVITTQPTPVTVTAPAAASFSVVVSPSGGTYVWQVKVGNAAYSTVTNGGVYSTATTATLNISNSTGLGGNKYRCVATTAGGTATVTSKSAVLTVE